MHVLFTSACAESIAVPFWPAAAPWLTMGSCVVIGRGRSGA
jgi:hypothetical protein